MTLSRTSRILLGFLLLSVAAFVWANLVLGDSGLMLTQAAGGDRPGSVESPAAGVTAPASPSASGSRDDGARPDGGRPGDSQGGLAQDPGARVGAVQDGSAQNAAPQVPEVAPLATVETERELRVLDLPFLVTEPLAVPQAPPQGEGASVAESAPARRATVNPFAPLVQARAAEPAPGDEPAPQAGPQQPAVVTEVPIPEAPRVSGQARTQAPSPAPRAPAPEPMAPVSAGVAALPQALPTGTLGGEPALLRRAIGEPARPLEELVVVEEPAPDQAPEADAAELLVDEAAAPAAVEDPRPLATTVAEPAGNGRRAPLIEAPLEAGISELSRFLRDRNVRFIGSVIGPVSVGVFRMMGTDAPIVISLGQPLPETTIILTDLRGQQAEFAQGDERQTLTLELRR